MDSFCFYHTQALPYDNTHHQRNNHLQVQLICYFHDFQYLVLRLHIAFVLDPAT